MKRAILSGCMLLAGASSARAEPGAARPLNHHTRDIDRFGWIVPDFGRLQTGGYSGLITVGLGYAALSDVINLGVDYGYVPKTHAGRAVHSWTASVGVRPIDIRMGGYRLVPGYLWGGLLFTEGRGYFFSAGDRYPPNHYKPTAVRALYGIGVELDWLPSGSSFFERHGVYWEARVFGPYFVTYLENPRQRSLTEVVSSTLGYRAAW